MKKYSSGKPSRFAGLWLLCLLHLLLSVIRCQAQTITGTVSDEKGTKLFSVSVMIKGTSQGTTTDSDGKYSLLAVRLQRHACF